MVYQAIDYQITIALMTHLSEICRRHAAHYESIVRRADDDYLKGGEALEAGLRLLTCEWPNIKAGQRWAQQNADRDDAAARLCVAYPDSGSSILEMHSHPRERIEWLEAALLAARRLNDQKAEGRHLMNLAMAYSSLTQPSAAIEHYERALKVMHETGDCAGELAALL